MKRIAVAVLLFLTAGAAEATDFASHHLLIPIAGRTAGINGSQWKTDLVLTNAGGGEPQTIEIYFIADAYLSHPVVTTLQPRQTIMVSDVISQFGKTTANGIIIIAVRDPEARLTARARIYNTGSPAGQYGQTVPAMPMTMLSREAIVPGLSAVDGNRTNVGIANPDSTPALVFISLLDSDGEQRGGFSTQVAPYSVLRLNNVFAQFPAGPLDGASIHVSSTHGVYTYASIVRADSGDADFVVGTSIQVDPSKTLVKPDCASPAQLSLAPLPSAGWTVLFKPGVNPFTATPTLEARHGFDADRVYEFGAFYTNYLPAAKLAALRCEPNIRVIEQNGFVPAF